MLRDPVFLSEEETFPPPPNWPYSAVQGKTYQDITKHEHADYFAPVVERLLHRAPMEILAEEESAVAATWEHRGAMFGDAVPTQHRLGQKAFKLKLLDAYEGQCAITRRSIRPALEAAHIHPVAKGGLHRLDNGLLLRADVHKLFDLGYLSVSPRLRVQVSPRLHKEFPDTEEYRALDGQEVTVPAKKVDRPSPSALDWHMSEVFRAE